MPFTVNNFDRVNTPLRCAYPLFLLPCRAISSV